MKVNKKILVLLAGLSLLALFSACNSSSTSENTTAIQSKEAPVLSKIEITDGQKYIYKPAVGENKTSAFNIKAYDQNGNILSSPAVTWSIVTEEKGVSIDSTGVVTITPLFQVADINGQDVTIKAVVNENTSISATIDLHIREVQTVGSFEVDGDDAVKNKTTAEYKLVNVKDQYGEDFIDVNSLNPALSASTSKIKVDGMKITPELTTTQETIEAIKIELNGISVVKNIVIHNKEFYAVDDTMKETLKNVEVDFSDDDTSVRMYNISEYTYVDKNVSGKTSVSVDVKNMKNYTQYTDYQVTIQAQDNSTSTSIVKADANGMVNIELNNAKAIEVSPVFKFSLGKNKLEETDGYTKVDSTVMFEEDSDYGFNAQIVNATNGVNLVNDAYAFCVALPDGLYDMTVTKAAKTRASIFVNGGAIGVNVGATGSGRNGNQTVFETTDVVISGGVAKISMANNFALAAVEFRRVSELQERKTHIFIGGDSTVCDYYPLDLGEVPEAGTVQTGWGQLFHKYTTDEVVVNNFAAGGTYAKSWYELFFKGVITHGQAGDYFIIQAGINDRSYSNVDEMVEYLNKMIDECTAKGIIPVLVDTQQTPKFWKSATGQEIGDYEKPEGSGLNAYMVAIRNLAKERNLLFVDNAELTGEWYTVVGREYVTKNYHIYDAKNDKSTDSLHSSYAGSLKIAELIATNIADQMAAGAKDGAGNTFDGIKLNEKTTYEIEHKNRNGETVKTSVTAVRAD